MTVFDTVAQRYWQEYLSGAPIAGGISYESYVRKCTLDESMDSLKMLDQLLAHIKKELDKKDDKLGLLKQSAFRNFLLFLAFYTGRVVARQLKTDWRWIDFETLASRHTLSAVENKFFLTMAGVPVGREFAPPFFALNIIGAKLFASADKKFKNPITKTLMPESLYWGVIGYLDDLSINETLKETVASAQNLHKNEPNTSAPKTATTPTLANKAPTIQATTKTASTPNQKVQALGATNLAQPSSKPSSTPPSELPSKPSQSLSVPAVNIASVSMSNPQANAQTPIQTSIQAQNTALPTLSQATTPNAKPVPNQGLSRRAKEKLERQKNTYRAHFKEIKHDLQTLPASNAVHDDSYQKAMGVINKVYELTDGDEEKLGALNPKQQEMLQKVIEMLNKLAELGNTNALLSLALCYFEGVGIEKNPSLAVPFVERAAELGDVRAAKFLSRIYYHGLGTNPSNELGETWLDKAALGGHEEAKRLKNQFEQIRLMREDYLIETQKDQKLYFVLIGAALFFVLIIFVAVKFL